MCQERVCDGSTEEANVSKQNSASTIAVEGAAATAGVGHCPRSHLPSTTSSRGGGQTRCDRP